MYNKKTFCIMPFIHQNLKNEGKIGACWRYPDRLGDFRKQSLEEIWNSKETKELRKSMLSGERHNGCRSCWDFEDSGVKSTRQHCNETYTQVYKVDEDTLLSKVAEDYTMPYEPVSVEIRFDNTCNYKCRHCSPAFSSQWETSFVKSYRIREFFKIFDNPKEEEQHSSMPEHTFEQLKNATPFLREVLIAGGEPLQQKKHWQMIEAMGPYAGNIVLSYNSNLSALGIGNWSVLDWWPKFKKIILRVSIDGYDDIYGYFRVNGDIKKVKENIKQIQTLENVILNVTCTVCIYNISRMTEIVRFTNDLGTLFHTSIVQYPRAINPKVLPIHIKEKITKDWQKLISNLDDENLWKNHSIWENVARKNEQKKRILQYGNYVIDYMNSENYSHVNERTKDYILMLDEDNNTDFSKTYPELIELIQF
jgi:MoaA/NifB/PqqE/SkfB family radical SAM enzyme